MRQAFAITLAALLGASAPAFALDAARKPAALLPGPVADPGYTFGVAPFVPTYRPPAPGSYELPPIRTVRDHGVVDSSGRDTTLERLTDDRIAVVAFFYGTCSDSAGCPLSTAVLHRLDQRLAADPEMARHVSLVSISFDPARDTPARLAEMEKARAPGSTWRFVTACDEAALQPILDDFGQSIAKLKREDGSATGLFRHVLKVYLVDGDRRVRNIYSVGLMNPDLVWNDIETLRRE